MASSFKARVNKLKSTRVSVSQKSEKASLETPLSSSLEEETLKAWIHSTNNINNISSAITRIESDVNSVKSDRERVIRLEVELEKLMQLIANKEYFKNIFMEMLESMESEREEEPEAEPEPEAEKEQVWKSYIDEELNNLRSVLNNTHSNISNKIENINFQIDQINKNTDFQEKIDFLEKKLDLIDGNYKKEQEIFFISFKNDLEEIQKEQKKLGNILHEKVKQVENRFSDVRKQHKEDISNFKENVSELKNKINWIDSQLNALKQDHALLVGSQKNLKNDIEILELFKNKQNKNNELFEETSHNIEKLKKENIDIKNNIQAIEKITKETSTIFVTKVADLVEYTKKTDKRSIKNEIYGKELGNVLESIKTMFEEEKTSLSKIISNLKDDFMDLHERCDHSLKNIYHNETQHIIDKYVFELSQLNVLFESSKTMQRENNYLKCIGNLSSRIDKIEQKIN